jgi:hypothetical protein
MSDEIYSSSENEASLFDFEKYLARCIEDRRSARFLEPRQVSEKVQ